MKKNKLINKIGVYQIRNKLNNKVYIGSSKDIGTRWSEHKRDLRMGEHRNSHLQNAYNKYGPENFIFEVLELLDSEDEQYEREQYWINIKDACNAEKGYNIQEVVLKVPPATKKVVCLETGEVFNSIKEASSKYNISSGSISCCCHKRKLKQAGGLHWMFYDEYKTMDKNDICEALMDTRFLPFICLDDGKIYKSWKELPYKKGLVTRSCNMLIRGKYATCMGKKYLYLKDYKKLSESEIRSIKDMKPQLRDTSGEVVCLETGEVFSNAYKASLKYGISHTRILNCCHGKSISCGNYHWLFRCDYDKTSYKDIVKMISVNSKANTCKAVVCLETKEMFESGAEASRKMNISAAVISKGCKNHGINTSVKSFHFMFVSEYNELSNNEIEKILNTVAKHVRKVRCVETGNIYNSVTEAAKAVKGETTNISKCCKNSRFVCKGYHWEYV